jgi:hypothetical protein
VLLVRVHQNPAFCGRIMTCLNTLTPLFLKIRNIAFFGRVCFVNTDETQKHPCLLQSYELLIISDEYADCSCSPKESYSWFPYIRPILKLHNCVLNFIIL